MPFVVVPACDAPAILAFLRARHPAGRFIARTHKGGEPCVRIERVVA